MSTHFRGPSSLIYDIFSNYYTINMTMTHIWGLVGMNGLTFSTKENKELSGVKKTYHIQFLKISETGERHSELIVRHVEFQKVEHYG
jgi:hypothetical protein